MYFAYDVVFKNKTDLDSLSPGSCFENWQTPYKLRETILARGREYTKNSGDNSWENAAIKTVNKITIMDKIAYELNEQKSRKILEQGCGLCGSWGAVLLFFNSPLVVHTIESEVANLATIVSAISVSHVLNQFKNIEYSEKKVDFILKEKAPSM